MYDCFSWKFNLILEHTYATSTYLIFLNLDRVYN